MATASTPTWTRLGTRMEQGLTDLFRTSRHSVDRRAAGLGLLHLLHGPCPRRLARNRREPRHDARPDVPPRA
jgi:hypothetical protein